MSASIVSFVVLALSFFGAGSESQLSAEARVLWSDADRTIPLFIPETALTPAGELKAGYDLPEKALVGLRRKLMQTEGGSDQPKCATPVIGDVPGPPGGIRKPPAQPASRIVRAIRDERMTSFIGEVTHVVPGWLAPYNYAASLVYVEVREILSNPDGELYDGSAVSYLQHSGTLRLGDRKLCTDDPPYYSAKGGDSVLVVGQPDRGNRNHISTIKTLVVPIINGMILTPPDSGQDDPPLDLWELRSRLRDVRTRPRDP